MTGQETNEARWVRPLITATLYALALGIVALVTFRLVQAQRTRDRGITWGLPPHIALAGVYPWGMNFEPARYPSDSALDAALQSAEDAGLRWARISFPWSEIEPTPGVYRWDQADRWIAAIRRHRLNLIAVLDRSPAWARAPKDSDNPHAPPQHYEDFGRFAATFARRYAADVAAYQIWDEPNIAPHWGNRFVDPVAYTFLLRTAAREIRKVALHAMIVTAALAPNVEPGGLNMSEVLFLRGMYGVGAARDFDVLAAEPYGFRTGPDDRRVRPDLLNFSRVLLLREEMTDWGDRDKPIWATAFGWNALPAGWSGRPSIWGTVTPEQQADYTVQAVERAQAEWPWMGVMLLPAFQPDALPDNPRWGFALLTPENKPTPLYDRLVKKVAQPWYAGPGWYPLDVNPASSAPVALSFRGTRLDLVVQAPLHVRVTIDGKANPREKVAPLHGRQRLMLAHGLADGPHRAEITVTQAGAGSRLTAFVVSRERTGYGLLLAKLIGLLAIGAALTWRLALAPRRLDPPPALRPTVQRLADLPDRAYLLLMAAAVAGLYLAHSWLLTIAAIVVIGIPYLLRPAVGLMLSAFAIPFFLLPKIMPNGMRFSLVEILTWVGVVAWALLSVLPPTWWSPLDATPGPANAPPNDRWRRALDLAVLTFVLLGLLSLTWATNFGTAARQFRVVVLEPALFYGLIRAFARDRDVALRLLDALVAAGLVLALHALWQAATGTGIITAEGVMRVRAVYGSPNNLALFLGRVIPMAVAVAIFAPPSRRRRAYAIVTVPLVMALFLTFSRGAWLIGLPAALIFLAWHGGRRLRIAVGGAIVAGLAVLVPFASTERVMSLLSLQNGTAGSRLNLWASTLDMIRDHPWGGVGLDNFLYLYPRYIRPQAWGEPALSHPHNILLHFWVTLGIGGVIILIWQQTVFWGVITRATQRSSAWERAMALALAASMVDFLAHGLIDQSYFLVDLAFVYMLTLGLAPHAPEKEETHGKAPLCEL
jgi:O-antigen ligase